MPGTLSPNAKFTGLDNEGNPLVGGHLYTYAARTSIPADTFTDVELAVANSNPVVLDAGGRCTLFLDLMTYKFVLKDAQDSLVWTQDDIASAGLGGSGGGGGVGEVFVFGGDSTVVVVNTAYPAGTDVPSLHAGTGLLVIDSATMIGVFALEAMLISQDDTQGPVRCALVNLTDGDPDTPIVEIQTMSEIGERVISGPISFAAPGALRTYGIKTKVDSGAGWVWQVKLTKISEGSTT